MAPMVWFWATVLPGLALAVFSLRGERRRATLKPRTGPLAPATLIVPVKGADEGLRENLLALASQDYPDYELIVAARADEDLPTGVVPAGARVIFSGSGDVATGEKIRNLLAAIAAARPSSKVFAFADSDGRPSPQWLRELVTPLSEPGVGAATGYRFFLPDPPDFISLLRSVWNAVVLETLRGGDAAFAWGGAMAVSRDVFSRARVAEFWKGAVSDDYALSDAVLAAGLRIRFSPGALVPAPGHTTVPEFFRFARRQLILTRVHRPRLWWTAAISTSIYCAAMLACLVRMPWMLIPLLAPGMWKGRRRATIARRWLQGHGPWFDRCGWAHTWLVPLSTWAWMFALLASAVSNTFEWRGIRYRVCNNHPKSPWQDGQRASGAAVRFIDEDKIRIDLTGEPLE